MWLNKRQRREVLPAETLRDKRPIPTRMISNGEFMPIGQTDDQRRLERTIDDLAARSASKAGIDRRSFLRSGAGMATAFVALNTVFGDYFLVGRAEAADPGEAAAARALLADQFVVDVQLHFVRDDYQWDGILALGEYAKRWNPALTGEEITFERFKFENFVKEVYFDSDTKIGLVSAAPSDHGDNVIMNNDGLADTRARINKAAGSCRMLSHAVIAPGQPGWLEEIDRAVEVLKPDGWKGYTLGDPFADSRYPWRLDDEDLMYPAYERMVKSGIRNVCVHKGLLPADFTNAFKHWRRAMVDDVGPAAKDWPELNFIIYHSGFRPLMTSPEPLLKQFEETGRIDWVTDLAETREKFGVENVYAELGTTLGSCAVTHPRLAAALLGTLIRGLGADHVVWGTDSVWYGSPQWQIEALRRIEIPAEMRARHGFAELGPAEDAVKTAILGKNATSLFGLQYEATERPWRDDAMAEVKAAYLAEGADPSATAYGFIRKAKEAEL